MWHHDELKRLRAEVNRLTQLRDRDVSAGSPNPADIEARETYGEDISVATERRDVFESAIPAFDAAAAEIKATSTTRDDISRLCNEHHDASRRLARVALGAYVLDIVVSAIWPTETWPVIVLAALVLAMVIVGIGRLRQYSELLGTYDDAEHEYAEARIREQEIVDRLADSVPVDVE